MQTLLTVPLDSRNIFYVSGSGFFYKKRKKQKTPSKSYPKTRYQKSPDPFILTCVASDVQQMDIYSNPLLQKSAEELFACSKTSHALFSSYKTSFVKVQTQCWCRIQWRISIVEMSCSPTTGPGVPCCWVWLLPLPLGMGKLLTDTFTTEELSKINPLKLLAYRTLHTPWFVKSLSKSSFGRAF